MGDPALYLGLSALLIAIASVLSRLKRCRSWCCSFSLQNGQANSPIRRWLQSVSRSPPEHVEIDLESAAEGAIARRRATSAPVDPTHTCEYNSTTV